MPLHPEAVPEFRFIVPCSPIPAKAVPAGDGWVHEVKFDGYRVQVHKVGSRVVMFSRNGHDFTDRFPSIAQLLHELPAEAAVLDGEVVASDADGRPNFARLHVHWTRPGTIHLWAFDLLAFNGRDLRPQPLAKRQACLRALLERFGCPAISLSETVRRRPGAAARRRAAGPRGCRQQAPRCALQVGRVPGLAQGQDGRLARGQQGAVAAVRVIIRMRRRTDASTLMIMRKDHAGEEHWLASYLLKIRASTLGL